MNCPTCHRDTVWSGSKDHQAGCWNPTCPAYVGDAALQRHDPAATARTVEERIRQGLPPRIEDVSILTRIATIMRLSDRRS